MSSEMCDRWGAYYASKIPKFGGFRGYHEMRLSQNNPYFNELITYSQPGERVAELGSGIATASIILGQKNRLVTPVDIDHSVLRLARENGSSLGVSLSSAQTDIFALPFTHNSFSLVYSHGVLEHFQDSLIVGAIKEALRIGNRFIFTVPLDFVLHRGMKEKLKLSGGTGDERYLPTQHWENLISKSGGVVKNKFSYWIPYRGWSKTKHLEKSYLKKNYGKGFWACYNVEKSV